MNIIADIAGQYETFLALLKKMPDDDVLSVGDMIDRGPNSRQVIEWFMKNGKALMGNHEHMMIDARKDRGIYAHGIWWYNGAEPTLTSYKMDIPEEVIDWAETLPLYMDLGDAFVAHSFLREGMSLEEACNVWNVSPRELDYTIIWNREYPVRMPDKFQIAGHNSQMGLKRFADDQGEFAICIDGSKSRKLIGIHYPSMKIYQQDYLDEGEW